MANGQSADENQVSRTSSSCLSSVEPHSLHASGVVSANQLGHVDPPLQQHERLDAVAGTVAETDGVAVRLALLELIVVAQPVDHARIRLLLRQPGERAGLLVHASVETDDHRLGEPVVAADLPVRRIVTGRDLQRPGAERGIDAFVRDHPDEALDERDDHFAADEILVSRVVRVDGDGDVREDRRWTHCRDSDVPVAVGERVARVRERVVDVLVVDLEIGDHARAAGAPVDDPRPAVEVALVVQVDEEPHDGVRVGVVEREAVAAIVERGAHRAELTHDLAAVVAQELPALLHEGLATQVAVVDALVGEKPDDDTLQRDRCMVVAGLPEGVEVAHAVPSMSASWHEAFSAWPMCSVPVTLGGGRQMTKVSRGSSASAL